MADTSDTAGTPDTPKTDDDPPVENPTWFGNVRYYFTEDDINHMAAKGYDLGTYDGVVGDAVTIRGVTKAGTMPKGDLPKWSKNRVQNFLNWMDQNFPLGNPPDPATAAARRGAVGRMAGLAAPAARIRKEVTTLGADEVTLLKKAFSGIMARDPSKPDSYFTIAGFHWYPARDQNRLFHCLHQEDRFLPWHRAHLKRFEDALRSVEGCAGVTLPYWDVTTPIPPLLYEAPFDKYKLQANIGHGYDPLTTSRYTPTEIAANLAQAGVTGQIDTALNQKFWEQFNGALIGAHDNGHVSCGSTMANQDISAFDPVFWFYHCNLDRVWLQWQVSHDATTLASFKSTCQDIPTDWLDKPALGVLPPFTEHAADTISFPDVDYAPPQRRAAPMAFENRTGNVAAARGFRIDSSAPLSVRVKDIDRSGIKGTFVVHLLADGKEVAQQAFFQPTEPDLCPSCKEKPQVAVDFRVDPAKILDKALSVEIHVPSQRAIGTGFPIAKAGKPTINVRHLIEGE
jgi:tyrosinase